MRFMIKFGIDLMSPFYTGDGASDLAHNLGAAKLVSHPSGLFTVAVCVMSNFSKSRVLALQLLTKMATITTGHKQVSDAVSMLRLRFGEPVRFKFLIGRSAPAPGRSWGWQRLMMINITHT